MLRWFVLGSALVLPLGCSSADDMGETIGVDTAQISPSGESAQETLDRRLAGGAAPGAINIDNDLYEFAFEWPREAAAIPALNTLMEELGESSRAEFEAMSQSAKDDAEKFDYPYRAYVSQWSWKVVADTPRFISLRADLYVYTGGAHGNSDFRTLIWDREGRGGDGIDRPTSDFFSDMSALDTALREPYCEALRLQRIERIGAEYVPDELGDACPPLSELNLAFATTSGKTIDQLVLLAPPYAVGSYAEGSYETPVAISPAILDTVKPAYRDGFALAPRSDD